MNGLNQIPFLKHGRSRAINAENPTGEKGSGGKAASNLGVGSSSGRFFLLRVWAGVSREFCSDHGGTVAGNELFF